MAKRRGRRRRRRWIVIGAALAVAAGGTAFGLRRSDGGEGPPTDPLPAAIAAAEREGRLVEEEASPLPPAQNAAPVWISAHHLFVRTIGGDSRARMVMEMTIYSGAPQARTMVQRVDSALTSLVWSSERSGARLPPTDELSPEQVLESVAHLGRLLGYRATLRAAAGEVDAAFADLEALRRLPDLMVQNGGLSAMTAATRVGETAEYAVRDCASLWAEDPARLARLASLPRSAFREDGFGAMVDYEFRRGLERMRTGDGPGGWPEKPEDRLAAATWLDDWRAIRAALDRGDFARKSEFSELAGRGPEAGATLEDQRQDRLVWYRRMYEAWAVARSGPALTDAYLHAVLRRPGFGEGRLAAHADPFGDGPLRIRRTSDGFVLWSVGPDGRDDEGKTAPELAREAGRRRGGFPGDLVLAFPTEQSVRVRRPASTPDPAWAASAYGPTGAGAPPGVVPPGSGYDGGGPGMALGAGSRRRTATER